MKTDNFSLRRFGMLLRTEFLLNKKVWSLTFTVYFFLVAFFAFGKYFFVELNSKRVIVDLLMTICFFVSIYLSQMVFKSYTNKNRAIITLMTPASKWEKYLTTILFCLGIPFIVFVSILLIVNNLPTVNNYLFNDFIWFIMLVTLQITLNFISRGVWYLISVLTFVTLIFLTNNLHDIYFLGYSEIVTLTSVVISVIALIFSWYLFKNYSTNEE